MRVRKARSLYEEIVRLTEERCTMHKIKQIFDVIEYLIVKLFWLILAVIGAIALIAHHIHISF